MLLLRSLSRNVILAGGARKGIMGTATIHRTCATSTTAAAPSRGESSLLQRFSSFLAGVGVTSLLGYYFLYQDVKRSTDLVKSTLSEITRRIESLEKK